MRPGAGLGDFDRAGGGPCQVSAPAHGLGVHSAAGGFAVCQLIMQFPRPLQAGLSKVRAEPGDQPGV